MSQEKTGIDGNSVVSTGKYYNRRLYLRLMGIIVGVVLLGWIALRIEFYHSIGGLKYIIMGDILWLLCFAALIAACFQKTEKIYIISIGFWGAYYLWFWWFYSKGSSRNWDCEIELKLRDLIIVHVDARIVIYSLCIVFFGLQIAFHIKKSNSLRLPCIVLSTIIGIYEVLLVMSKWGRFVVCFPICAGCLVLVLFITCKTKKLRITLPAVILAITGGVPLAIWLLGPIRSFRAEEVSAAELDEPLVAVFVMTFCLFDIVCEYKQAKKHPRVTKVNVYAEEKRQQIDGDANAYASTRVVRLFCPSCGARFPEGKKFCDQCGSALSELAQPEISNAGITTNAQDAPSMGVAILGFFIPVAGFFMWASWNNTMPRKAKSAGKGALIGLITYVVLITAYNVAVYVWIASMF